MQSLAYALRVFERLGTAASVQRKHDALLTMQWLHILRHTPGELVKATLLVNVSTKMVYHMVYPHTIETDNYASITMC